MVDSSLRSPLSVQKVSALLRKGGFPRSASSTTTVRGWHNYSEGYHCYKHFHEAGAVGVRWRMSSFARRGVPYERSKLQAIADYLQAQNLDTVQVFSDDSNVVVVRGKYARSF